MGARGDGGTFTRWSEGRRGGHQQGHKLGWGDGYQIMRTGSRGKAAFRCAPYRRNASNSRMWWTTCCVVVAAELVLTRVRPSHLSQQATRPICVLPGVCVQIV